MPPNALVERDLRSRVNPDAPVSVGERLVADPCFDAITRSTGKVRSGDLLTQNELVGALRTRATPSADLTSALGVASQQAIQELPLSSLLGAIEVVPVDHPTINVWTDAAIVNGAGPAAVGVELGHVGGDWSLAFAQQMPRWGAMITAPLSIFDDKGQARVFVDRLFRKALARAVSVDVLAGSGSGGHLNGIANASGLHSYTRSTTGTADYNSDALARGIAAVQGDSFDDGFTVVAHPTTLANTLLQRDSSGNYLRVREALPAVTRWVPAAWMTPGSAYVGDFRAGDVLYQWGGLTMEFSREYYDATHGNYLTANLVAVKIETYLFNFVQNPGAFCLVSGLI